jgi:hypothetical protein
VGFCLQLVEEISHMESAAQILERCEAVARDHYPDLLT